MGCDRKGGEARGGEGPARVEGGEGTTAGGSGGGASGGGAAAGAAEAAAAAAAANDSAAAFTPVFAASFSAASLRRLSRAATKSPAGAAPARAGDCERWFWIWSFDDDEF